MMNGPELHDVYSHVAKEIARNIKNPNDWATVVRDMAEQLRLDVSRCVESGTLQTMCAGVCREANLQQRSEQAIYAAAAKAISDSKKPKPITRGVSRRGSRRG